MPKELRPACLVLAELEREWYMNSRSAKTKFKAAIRNYERHQQPLAATLCRCGLVQLMNGYNAQVLTGLGLSEEQLRKEAGA